MSYHDTAFADNTGLPNFSGMPLLDWREAANSNTPRASYPSGLTVGGRIFFERTRRPVSTCNALAALAGIGPEASHG